MATAVIGLVGLGIVLRSAFYLHPNFDQGFLLGKAEVWPWYRWGLLAHAVAAPVALLVGLAQWRLPKSRAWHARLGKVYGLSVLAFAVPGALVLLPEALGGLAGQVGFTLLILAWALTTALGWRRQGYPSHGRWMLRSYLLCCSAVLLRLLGFAAAKAGFPPTQITYAVLVWLSWLPGWLLLELIWWKRAR